MLLLGMITPLIGQVNLGSRVDDMKGSYLTTGRPAFSQAEIPPVML